MRRKDREITDLEEILCLLKEAKILHLAMRGEEYPYIVPMHYGFEYIEERDSFVFYVHCAMEGRKLDLLRKDPRVCIEIEDRVIPIDGGEDPCRYGAYYASFIAEGTVQFLEEKSETIHGLECLMLQQTGKSFPITEEKAEGVMVLRITTEHYSAKAKKPQ